MLAGGAGTRFWPASRAGLPKPFVRLLGDRTPLDDTLERLYRVAPADRISVVAPRRLDRVARRALSGHPGVRLIREPVARDTAAAIAWAAADAAAHAPDALLGIFPADHLIPSPAAFARAVRLAARSASRLDAMVLIGIEPTRPDTAYGYLRIDGEGLREAAPVGRFVEKPDAARARRYRSSGRYLWNAGMLVAPARRVLSEVQEHAPGVWRALGALLELRAEGRRVPAARLERAWRRVQPLSFDYAVLERSRRVFAVRGRFQWSDLGSWDALSEHLRPVDGNRVAGTPPALSLDSRENVIWNTSGRAWVLLGVEGLVLVETEDAVLVCRADRSQELRRVVQDLARRGRGDLT